MVTCNFQAVGLTSPACLQKEYLRLARHCRAVLPVKVACDVVNLHQMLIGAIDGAIYAVAENGEDETVKGTMVELGKLT